MPPLERILVIGNTGSGKSTLAEELARRLGLAFVELDALFWLPGWTEPTTEAFRAKVQAATAGRRWVTAGQYFTRIEDVTWPEAQVAVHLDLGLGRSVWRVTRRAWRRWRSRELLWGTNTETFAKHLKLWDPAESLITFAVLSHRRRRPGMLARRHDPRWAHIHFVRLRSPREVERWLEAVTRPPRTRPAT